MASRYKNTSNEISSDQEDKYHAKIKYVLFYGASELNCILRTVFILPDTSCGMKPVELKPRLI